ncbi:MAG TPA: hypothetical protein VFV10_20855 [Gammaproteobacteria bacterium]|nr:hypothetical protein [Gammaproteobacteria bacterium]
MNARLAAQALVLAAALCLLEPAAAQVSAPPSPDALGGAVADPQALADRIEKDVAGLRGLAFLHGVKVENQSAEDFQRYLDREIADAVPPAVAENYGDIVRELGLYRGTENLDFRGTMKEVMTSQVAAYYDPERSTFFVLARDLPAGVAGAFYAHELYHGLQDQHFDLDAYLLKRQRDRSLDDDELMARQAVVEGEATYVMLLWTIKGMLGTVPPRALLEPAVRLQSEGSLDSLKASLQQPGVAAALGDDVSAALDSVDEIPAFVLETMLGAYLKGLGFVFDVQAGGWSEVEKLYTEYPPQSTEQILHPEKWQARENPWRIEWPSIAGQDLFAGWRVLDENVVGEIQWRIIFSEHGLKTEAEGAAAGWNGDRYAVLRNEDSDALMLLLRTAWDTEDDAAEFASAYERLLAVKYAGRQEPTRVVRDGEDVLVVEGGSEESLGERIAFLQSARKTKRPSAP